MLPYPTTDANVLQLPQWNNIALSAWSLTWLVPVWYYDGTETITASDTDLNAGNIKSWINIFGTVWTYAWDFVPSPSAPLWYMKSTVNTSGLFNAYTGDPLATLNYIGDAMAFFWQSQWGNFYLDVTKVDLTTKVVSSIVYSWSSGSWNFLWDLYLDGTTVHMNYNASWAFGSTPRHNNYDLTTNTITFWANAFNTTWVLLTPSTVISWITYTGWIGKPATASFSYIGFKMT